MNAFVANGWLRTLTPREQSLWLIYHTFASVDGDSHWSDGKIAEILGHARLNHIAEARNSLVSKKLLEIMKSGRGSQIPYKVKLLIPPPQDQKVGVKNSPESGEKLTQIGTDPVVETHPDRVTNSPESGEKLTQIGTTLYKIEQTNEQTNNRPRSAGTFSDADRLSLFRSDKPEPATSKTKSHIDEILTIPIPPEIASQDFSAEWLAFITRRERMTRDKRLTVESAKTCLRKMARWGADRALEALEASNVGGWQGVFEPKGVGRNGTQRRNQGIISTAIPTQARTI